MNSECYCLYDGFLVHLSLYIFIVYHRFAINCVSRVGGTRAAVLHVFKKLS